MANSSWTLRGHGGRSKVHRTQSRGREEGHKPFFVVLEVYSEEPDQVQLNQQQLFHLLIFETFLEHLLHEELHHFHLKMIYDIELEEELLKVHKNHFVYLSHQIQYRIPIIQSWWYSGRQMEGWNAS